MEEQIHRRFLEIFSISVDEFEEAFREPTETQTHKTRSYKPPIPEGKVLSRESKKIN